MSEDSSKPLGVQIDEQLAKVMPDYWEGHARLWLHGRDLSEQKKEKVLEHTSSILDKNPQYAADKVAAKVVEKLGDS